MELFRIVKSKIRTTDLSGKGAFMAGGRWNSEGVYALYTSESSSLAMLEVLVHLHTEELPSDMYLVILEVSDEAEFEIIESNNLPEDWRRSGHAELKNIGDKILKGREKIGFKVLSAVFPFQYNFILNPEFPEFSYLVNIKSIHLLKPDFRLFGNS